jgi:hypothetical protein
MIEIFRKKAGLLVRELYFAPGMVPSDVNRDIDFYVQCSSPIMGSTPFWTLTADLSQDEDALFQGLSKGNRYEVRRAVKDGLVFDVDFTPTIEAIDSFKSFFNDFAAFRGIAPANIVKLESFRRSGNLSICSVRRSNENFPLAMHCTVSDDCRVRAQNGGTLPRVGDNGQLLGRANRLLEWQTMLAMKKAGKKIYDFGGISRSTELQCINDFKRQFGGIEREEYNAVLGISQLGRLALKTSDLLSRFTKTADS